jgi:hypothetical protein
MCPGRTSREGLPCRTDQPLRHCGPFRWPSRRHPGRAWVRRGTTEPGLVRYYRDVQGWSVVREKERDGFLVTGLARRAELQPGLPVRVAS